MLEYTHYEIMQRRDQEARIQRLLRSKLVFVVEAALLLLIGIALTRQVVQRHSIDREISRLKQEYEELEMNSADLQSLISYFQTDEYMEEEARTKLGLVKPGEGVVILPEAVEQGTADAQTQASSSQSDTSNSQRWWDFFFGYRTS